MGVFFLSSINGCFFCQVLMGVLCSIILFWQKVVIDIFIVMVKRKSIYCDGKKRKYDYYDIYIYRFIHKNICSMNMLLGKNYHMNELNSHFK
jgi:hypothetical protein